MAANTTLAADLDHVASLLRDERNRVVVLAGAGTSTSAGIPDFRSPGTGLYDNLAAYELPYPEAVFDLEYFEERPQPFYTLARDLWPGVNYPPTLTHSFYSLLHSKQRLISVLTQNIDGLERAAGVPDELLVEAHGSFATASCIACRHPASSECVKQHVLQGSVARCESEDCRALHEDGVSGLVKPDIVFFGEGLPRKFFTHLDDVAKADVVLVLGTSLVVDPFGSLVYDAKPSATSVLINRDLYPAGKKFRFRATGRGKDVALLGSCDDIVRQLARRAGWEKDLDEIHTSNLRRHDVRAGAAAETKSAAQRATAAAADVGATVDRTKTEATEEVEAPATPLMTRQENDASRRDEDPSDLVQKIAHLDISSRKTNSPGNNDTQKITHTDDVTSQTRQRTEEQAAAEATQSEAPPTSGMTRSTEGGDNSSRHTSEPQQTQSTVHPPPTSKA